MLEPARARGRAWPWPLLFIALRHCCTASGLERTYPFREWPVREAPSGPHAHANGRSGRSAAKPLSEMRIGPLHDAHNTCRREKHSSSTSNTGDDGVSLAIVPPACVACCVCVGWCGCESEGRLRCAWPHVPRRIRKQPILHPTPRRAQDGQPVVWHSDSAWCCSLSFFFPRSRAFGAARQFPRFRGRGNEQPQRQAGATGC